MSFLNKLGLSIGAGTAREISRQLPFGARPGTSGSSAHGIGTSRPPERQEFTRVSNGLKELLWNLEGLGRGALLDLGPAWQTTITFFIERGFRVSSEDILRSWGAFYSQEDAKRREFSQECQELDFTAAGMAARFLGENLRYPNSSVDTVLLWDLLDYLEPTLARQVVSRITDIMRPGGLVFAMFHSKKPLGFQRYRVADSNLLQVVETAAINPAQKVYQNREIQDLFGRFRTMKTFVSRDQLRETLFIK
jgi:hypothetical protein